MRGAACVGPVLLGHRRRLSHGWLQGRDPYRERGHDDLERRHRGAVARSGRTSVVVSGSAPIGGGTGGGFGHPAPCSRTPTETPRRLTSHPTASVCGMRSSRRSRARSRLFITEPSAAPGEILRSEQAHWGSPIPGSVRVWVASSGSGRPPRRPRRSRLCFLWPCPLDFQRPVGMVRARGSLAVGPRKRTSLAAEVDVRHERRACRSSHGLGAQRPWLRGRVGAGIVGGAAPMCAAALGVSPCDCSGQRSAPTSAT